MANQEKVPFMGPWAAGTPVTKNGGNPNFAFRVSAVDEIVDRGMLAYAQKTFKASKPGMILVNNAWGESNEKGLTAALSAKGIQSAGIEKFDRITSYNVCYTKLLRILFQTVQLGRTGYRHDPRFLRQQPGERDLCSRCTLGRSDAAEYIDQVLVRLASGLGKARHDVAKIARVELRIGIDRTGQEALAERAEGNKTDTQFFEQRQNLLFRFSPPQRVS